MTDFYSDRFPILFRRRWPTRGLSTAIQAIDPFTLCHEYHELRKAAPSRFAKNKRYFVGHDGHVRAINPANPSEEHLAIALWRLDTRWPRTCGGSLRFLDYQFPLKSSRSDAGLGKVDLLGVTDEGRSAVVELKVPQKKGARGDTPVLALMEGLRYAAIVEANHRAISEEVSHLGIALADTPPIVQILAPQDWWRGWCHMPSKTRTVAGHWERSFAELAGILETQLGVTIEFVSLQGTRLSDVTWDTHGPRLRQRPNLRTIHLHPESG